MYGPADGMVRRPASLYGVSGLTAPNHCMAMIETNVAFGLLSVIVSFWPLATTPEIFCVLPARKSSPPLMTFSSWMFTPTGEPIFGLRMRSIDRWNAAAVTGDPSLNLSPWRTVNV